MKTSVWVKTTCSLFALAFALNGCATLQKARTRAGNLICDNEQAILTAAKAVGDVATVQAVTDFCDLNGSQGLQPVATPTVTPSAEPSNTTP